VLVPVKTTDTGDYRIEAHNGSTGQLMWEVSTDYTTPASEWTPSFSPVLTPQGGLYFQGAGGTVYYIADPDSSTTPVVTQLAFYGLSNYTSDPTTYNNDVQICTPITSDSAGDIFFGFVVTGTTGAGLESGLARISASGQGTWAAATTMANDSTIVSVDYNCSPALSNDEKTVYIAVNTGDFGSGYLLALDSTTLVQTGRVALVDPKSGEPAELPDISTASPVVGPDGDVYFGVLENPFPENNDRGWLLHFNAALTQVKTPGAFGWDDTPSIVPASMVPSYTGTSSYLLMCKYNNYAGIGTGDGQNKVAILDPNDVTEIDPVTGATVMNPVLTILGPTPDPDHPGGVREWCINAAAVDPATDSILVNSEDGTLYRWNLSTNTFTQSIHLAAPTGEAYTPTVIGGDGTVYAINNATLWAVGDLPQISIADTSVNQSTTANVNATFTVTLAQPDSSSVTVDYTTVDGTALAGQDYVATTGSVDFAPGQTTQTFTVAILPTTIYAPSKTFGITLSSPTNANLQNDSAVGTIVNPLPPPMLSIDNVSAADAQSGTTPFIFTVTLSAVSSVPITVDYATADGTAVAPTDYASLQGTLTFTPGQTSQNIVIEVAASSQSGPTKTFTVNLSNPTIADLQTAQGTGSILNGVGALSISDVSGTLSETAETNFLFTISLANPVAVPVTVQFSTADGSAIAGTDYQSLTSTLPFAPGQTTEQVIVVVNRNPYPGPTLNFTVNLSNPTNAILIDGQGVGTILNDNLPSIFNFSASQYSAKETDGSADISLVRSGDLTRTVTIDFTAGGGNSSPATEYQPVSETITFDPGDTVKTVAVPLVDDHQVASDQLVQMTLSDPSAGGSLGSATTATLTIKNEDGTPNQRYVFYTYVALLQRSADPGGLAYWSGLLDDGLARAEMILRMEASVEYEDLLVNSFYSAYLGRAATASELASGVTTLSTAQTAGSLTPQNELRAQILASNEYFANQAGGTNSGFLTALYQDLLGRPVDPVGSMVFGTALANGAPRSQIVQTILLSQETEQDLVKGYYTRFLERLADTGGLSFFTAELQQGIPENSVAAAILASDEFFALAQSEA
jgi:hypothetical protein